MPSTRRKRAQASLPPREEEEAGHEDWRALLVAEIRRIASRAAPRAALAPKWRGVPTWSDGGLLFTAETYRLKVKMTFAHGASLPDPAGLFNAGLEGKTRRAIDFTRGCELRASALGALIAAAVAYNRRRGQ